MIKNIIGYAAIIFLASIFALLGVLGTISWYNKGIDNLERDLEGLERDLEGIDSVRTTIPIVGTGTHFNDGIIASSTITTDVLQTIFSFASSTSESWWDTTVVGFPHLYGATTTVYLENRSADLISFNGVFKGAETASSFIFEIAGSNDSDCGLTTSNTADWYPISLAVTTSTESAILVSETETNTISPASTASTTFAFALKNINYNCTRLIFYNNSTTDESLLYVEATFKEN